MFKLDERLLSDTFRIGRLPLCEVLLMNDSQFPWVILVPQREGMTEILDLTRDDQTQLWEESRQVCLALREICQPDKLNIAALGNVVSQLHLHHVARYITDVAWPAPVWGRQPVVPYPENQKVSLCQQLAEKLGI